MSKFKNLNSFTTKFFSLFILILAFNSCNVHIEKRKYGKGFFIQTNRHKDVKGESLSQSTDTVSILQLVENSSPKNLNSSTPSYNVKPNQPQITNEIHSDDSEKSRSYEPVTNNKKEEISILRRSTDKTSAMTLNNRSGEENKNKSDFIFYALASFLGIITFGWLKRNGARMVQLKKWARNHRKSSFGLLILGQTLLGILGFLIGKNLFELGYQGSSSMFQVFGIISSLSLLGILFHKRKNGVPLRGFYRQTIPQLAIGVSFWMTGIGVGNQMNSEDRLKTPVGMIIDSTEVSQSEEMKSENLTENNRARGMSDEEKRGWMIFGFVLLSILVLLICFGLTCAVWCWALSEGTAGPITAAIVVSMVILGLLFLMFSGMSRAVNKKYPKEKNRVTE